MGLIGSLSSIFYVALLLLLVFYLYGIICVSFFRENDPVHFGNLETTFLTLFRMSTLEDWSDVMYTQLYGCDVYPYHFRCKS
jgi:voltage-gated sodium channel